MTIPVDKLIVQNPLVSVVIPTYNFGHLLPFALDSLLAQTYTHWECLIIDDGSKDNTEEVVAAYLQQDSRFNYIKQQNSGPGQARNRGIDNAKGEYLQFLDADDLLSPEKLAYQIMALEQYSNADVIYGPTLHFKTTKANHGDAGELYNDRFKRPEISGSGKEIVKTFLQLTFFPSCSIIKRSLVKELHGLDVKLIQSEDWDLYLRAAQKGARFQYLADTPIQAKALIREHDSNNTRNFYRLQYYVVKMRQKFAQSCQEDDLLQLNNRLMHKNLEDLVFQITTDMEAGNRKQAIDRSVKLYKLYPSFRYLLLLLSSMLLPKRVYRKISKFSVSTLLKR